MIDWLTLSARLSVFLAPDAVVSPSLWREVVGDEPDQSSTQRTLATRTETGPFAEGKLTHQVQPVRVDWVYEPPENEPFTTEPMTLGPFPGATDPLLKIAKRWLEVGFPAAQRIALGFQLMIPCASREAGYEELKHFIDGVPGSGDATDFAYQVNRPRAAGTAVEGLRINRLSKWSVGAFRSIAMSTAAATPIVGEMRFHLRVDLDLHTAPDYPGLLPKEQMGQIIQDLREGAIEISERGNRF